MGYIYIQSSKDFPFALKIGSQWLRRIKKNTEYTDRYSFWNQTNRLTLIASTRSEYNHYPPRIDHWFFQNLVQFNHEAIPSVMMQNKWTLEETIDMIIQSKLDNEEIHWYILHHLLLQVDSSKLSIVIERLQRSLHLFPMQRSLAIYFFQMLVKEDWIDGKQVLFILLKHLHILDFESLKKVRRIWLFDI